MQSKNISLLKLCPNYLVLRLNGMQLRKDTYLYIFLHKRSLKNHWLKYIVSILRLDIMNFSVALFLDVFLNRNFKRDQEKVIWKKIVKLLKCRKITMGNRDEMDLAWNLFNRYFGNQFVFEICLKNEKWCKISNSFA